jgi:hypothetical protein
MNYQQCPRCHKDWLHREYAYINYCNCADCNISYWDDQDGELLCLSSFLEDDDELSWDWFDKTCNYWHINPYGNNYTKLPWLPIDITKEKLKLYLLFS